MKKRRERAGNVRATERGRVRFRTDDRNVFWLQYTTREEEREKERGGREAEGKTQGNKKKKDREKGKNRARIYRVTLSGLFQRRPKAELVLSSSFQSRPFIKSSRGRANIFPRIHSQDFLPRLSPFFLYSSLFMSCRVTPENMTLFRKRLRAAFFIRAIINSARERRTRRKV